MTTARHRPSLLASCLAASLVSLGALADGDPARFDVSAATSPLTPTATVAAVTTPAWMSPEVGDAWARGYKGQSVTLKLVDDFSGNLLTGKLNGTTQTQTHGNWTRLEASLVAPSAAIATHDLSNTGSVALASGRNVVNLSYSMYAVAGLNPLTLGWAARESSLISYAKNGNAVIVKAAGNDAVNLGSANAQGNVDYLNVSLRATNALFVGALNGNGSTTTRTSLASYSNKPGSDTSYQNRFLSVGVAGEQTGLYGTSFAAPIVAGYAAILGSKFTKATPNAIANQLLNTARTDTIAGYSAAVHGRGEASLTRALAPTSIK